MGQELGMVIQGHNNIIRGGNNMNFRIQVSKPYNNGEFCYEDKKLSEAIETIFPMMTEDAFLVWNHIYIPLNYKYDVSYMIEDILSMLKRIRDIKGEIKINWASNSFACSWILVWNKDDLNINTSWNCVTGNTEELLNSFNNVKINKTEFICEWKMILGVIIENLEKCGYNKDNLKDMNIIYEEFNLIKEYGILYSNLFN